MSFVVFGFRCYATVYRILSGLAMCLARNGYDCLLLASLNLSHESGLRMCLEERLVERNDFNSLARLSVEKRTRNGLCYSVKGKAWR